VGRLTQLVDLEREIVGTEPIWVAGWRALVNAGGQGTHLGNLVGYFLAHQMSAQANLTALTDENFAGVGKIQVVGIKAVARLNALVDPLSRISPLIGDHAALARAGRRARHGRSPRERDLCFVGQRSETHASDVDRDIEHDRALGARTEHGLGLALLAVALDDEARQRARQEGEIVPARNLLEYCHTAHAVAAKLGLDMDVVDHLRREQEVLTKDVPVASRLAPRL